MLLVFVCVAAASLASAEHDQGLYQVPDPTIVTHPRGFEVSIPDDDGIQLFAFHGNINKPLEGWAAGTFSRDVLKKTKDRWVFKDKRTRLHPGDTIYYWLFVIKDNLGYRYDDGVYTVPVTDDDFEDDIKTSGKPFEGTENLPPLRTECNQTVLKSKDDLYQEILINITSNMIKKDEQIKDLEDNNTILRKILEDSPTASSLTFAGVLPPGEDALYTVINLLRNKLLISDVKVKNVKYNDNKTISFEVFDLDDKIKIVGAAIDKLRDSKIKLMYY